MKLSVRSLAFASGILWGGAFLIVGLLNLTGGGYGAALLDFGASMYPGYGGPAGFGSVIVVTLWGLVDGAVCGALLAWFYNLFLKDSTMGAAA